MGSLAQAEGAGDGVVTAVVDAELHPSCADGLAGKVVPHWGGCDVHMHSWPDVLHRAKRKSVKASCAWWPRNWPML